MGDQYNVVGESFTACLRYALELAYKLGPIVGIATEDVGPVREVCRGLGLGCTDLSGSDRDGVILIKPEDAVLTNCSVIIFWGNFSAQLLSRMDIITINGTEGIKHQVAFPSLVVDPAQHEFIINVKKLTARELVELLEGEETAFYVSNVMGIKRKNYGKQGNFYEFPRYIGSNDLSRNILEEYLKTADSNAKGEIYFWHPLDGSLHDTEVTDAVAHRIENIDGRVKIWHFHMISTIPDYPERAIKRTVMINALLARARGWILDSVVLLYCDGRVVGEFIIPEKDIDNFDAELAQILTAPVKVTVSEAKV